VVVGAGAGAGAMASSGGGVVAYAVGGGRFDGSVGAGVRAGAAVGSW
jgi:hypothetical protein